MIRIDDIEKVRVRNGYVLVEVDFLVHEQVTTKSGFTMWVSSISGTAKTMNCAKHGIVRNVGEKIGDKQGWFSLDEKPVLRAGDKVWFDYLVVSKYLIHMKGGEEPQWPLLVCGDRSFFAFPYGLVFMAEREGERFGVNRNVFGRKVMKTRSTIIEMPDEVDEGILEVVTLPFGYEGDIEKGDRVVTNVTARPIESDLHDDENLYFVPLHRVVAIKQKGYAEA